MKDRSFREEALKFALDGDSVQNLLRVAASGWDLDRLPALETIVELAREGLLTIYEHDTETGDDIPVDARELSLAHLNARPYTFLLRTDRTIPALEALSEDNPSRRST